MEDKEKTVFQEHDVSVNPVKITVDPTYEDKQLSPLTRLGQRRKWARRKTLQQRKRKKDNEVRIDTWEQKTICCGTVFIGPQDQILIIPRFLQPHQGPCTYDYIPYLWETGQIVVETDEEECSTPQVPTDGISKSIVHNETKIPQNGIQSEIIINEEYITYENVVNLNDHQYSNTYIMTEPCLQT
ncbi:hypothetical protein RF11_07618 [Thelohanellus kitauei]|uniref:Uncharacterized protein n=1 Tax=Thelohanellus kitauei TaxID=669202 RepID=A0A0C2JBF9_THEKT|nr:hypothetical protein RF11_07618 [Thelohanellus kitauei]